MDCETESAGISAAMILFAVGEARGTGEEIRVKSSLFSAIGTCQVGPETPK